MTNSHNNKVDEDQYLRFEVLVPLVSDMLIKYQKEAGSMTKADSSARYTKAVEMIADYTDSKVREARIDEIKKLRKESEEVYVETNGYCKYRLATLRGDKDD